MAWYLFQRGSHILLPLCLDDDCRLHLSSSPNSPILIAPPLLPAWSPHLYFLPGYWPISICLKYKWQGTDHCPTAVLLPQKPWTESSNQGSPQGTSVHDRALSTEGSRVLIENIRGFSLNRVFTHRLLHAFNVWIHTCFSKRRLDLTCVWARYFSLRNLWEDETHLNN